MAYSQFRIYRSADSGSPIMNATTGSLVALLDAVLVNGYGSQPGAGWLKPFSNSGSLGCWKQPSGSMCTLVVSDTADRPSAFGKEAWACGWDYLTALGPILGTGSGQFPLPTQGVTAGSGSVIFRKANTSTSILPDRAHQWICFADAWTFYLFIQTQDTAGQYRACWFGDIWSAYGPDDTTKCMIHGNGTKDQSTGGSTNGMYEDTVERITQATPGFFLQRQASGRQSSLTAVKMGDIGKTNGSFPVAMVGIIPAANSVDRSYYISPVLVGESANSIIRGRMRGMYHVTHPITAFNDGQVIYGGGDYAGKSFHIVRTGPNSGMWAIEISNTVEVN